MRTSRGTKPDVIVNIVNHVTPRSRTADRQLLTITGWFEVRNQYLFRNVMYHSYMNRKRSEQRLIKNFQNKFGKPEDTIMKPNTYISLINAQ